MRSGTPARIRSTRRWPTCAWRWATWPRWWGATSARATAPTACCKCRDRAFADMDGAAVYERGEGEARSEIRRRGNPAPGPGRQSDAALPDRQLKVWELDSLCRDPGH